MVCTSSNNADTTFVLPLMSQQEQLCVDNFKKSNPAFNRPRHDSLKTDLSSFLAQSCTDQHEVSILNNKTLN